MEKLDDEAFIKSMYVSSIHISSSEALGSAFERFCIAGVQHLCIGYAIIF
jgi:hypothetical protein